jgi:hypothetical protein
MRVPNVNIVIRSEKRHGAVKVQPPWYAEMYRRVWSGRLDPEKGIEIIPIDPLVEARVRYSEYADVGEAERMTVAYFAHGDTKRVTEMSNLFNSLFPQGLRPVIEKLLREDLASTRDRLAALRDAPTAHQSFILAGLSTEHAIALQKAGYATVAEVDTDDVIKLGEAGLDAEAMTKVINAQASVTPITAANPLTAAAQG